MSFNGPFLKRLVRLSGQAESVQAIAGYILLHSGHAKQLVHNWLVVLRAARSDRVLPLIYVANDVVQRAAARKLNVFIKEFGEVFHEAMCVVHWRCPENRGRVNRVINIVEERRIYSGNACTRWRNTLHSAPSSTRHLASPLELPAAAAAAMEGRSAAGPAAAEAASLSEALEDAAFRQRVTTAVASRVRHLSSELLSGGPDLPRLQTLPRAQREAEATDALRACSVLARLRFCAEESLDANTCLVSKLRAEAAQADRDAKAAVGRLGEVEDLIRRLEAAQYLAEATVPGAGGGPSPGPGAVLSLQGATPTAAGAAAGVASGLTGGVSMVGSVGAASSLDMVGGLDESFTPRLLHRGGSTGSGSLKSASGAAPSDMDLLGAADEEDEEAEEEARRQLASEQRAKKRGREDEGKMVYNPIAREYQPVSVLDSGEDWRD
ncbi:hypothetical protein FNF27_00052 [Cafeteria roenbergensis]|uniref:CID domain-containing protein n=1 Tax=Cafeteria roenbergensis TaxID=33653 RepID=A0A5A8DT82_CAFRO|nr:hypothetical protein FNF31_06289 [Cafeteria roenbergensis]KAA0168652.1 hypothetical protein FNF28_02392 [Cafeteria roenbergensis]KAA0178198.1 hypothetical protein FNF27_00052 [Cafeteria roenbergensis]